MLGVGAQHTKDPNGIAWKQNRDFENLLKRLNANSEGPTEDEVGPAPIDGFQRARVHEPDAGQTKIGLETEGGDDGGEVMERKAKKKKRTRDDLETKKREETKLKKRKQVESTVGTPVDEPMEESPPDPSCPTPETIPSVVVYRSRGNPTPDP